MNTQGNYVYGQDQPVQSPGDRPVYLQHLQEKDNIRLWTSDFQLPNYVSVYNPEPTHPQSSDIEGFSTNIEDFFSLVRSIHKRKHGSDIHRIPVVGGQALDLFKLYKEVKRYGGIEEVSRTRKFKEIAKKLELSTKITNIGHAIKKHYLTLLQPIEPELEMKIREGGMVLEKPISVKVDPYNPSDVVQCYPRRSPIIDAEDFALAIQILVPDSRDYVNTSAQLFTKIPPRTMDVALNRWPLDGVSLTGPNLGQSAAPLPANIVAMTVSVDAPIQNLRPSDSLLKLALVANMRPMGMAWQDQVPEQNIKIFSSFVQHLPFAYPALRSLHLDMTCSVMILTRPEVSKTLEQMPHLTEIGLIDAVPEVDIYQLIESYPNIRHLYVHSLDRWVYRPTTVTFGEVIPQEPWRRKNMPTLTGAMSSGPMEHHHVIQHHEQPQNMQMSHSGIPMQPPHTFIREVPTNPELHKQMMTSHMHPHQQQIQMGQSGTNHSGMDGYGLRTQRGHMERYAMDHGPPLAQPPMKLSPFLAEMNHDMGFTNVSEFIEIPAVGRMSVTPYPYVPPAHPLMTLNVSGTSIVKLRTLAERCTNLLCLTLRHTSIDIVLPTNSDSAFQEIRKSFPNLANLDMHNVTHTV